MVLPKALLAWVELYAKTGMLDWFAAFGLVADRRRTSPATKL